MKFHLVHPIVKQPITISEAAGENLTDFTKNGWSVKDYHPETAEDVSFLSVFAPIGDYEFLEDEDLPF